MGKCAEFKKNEHSHLLHKQSGFSDNQRRPNNQSASLAEWNPVLHDNAWVSGHDNGNRAWGWAAEGGDESGGTEGNAVSPLASEASDTNHSMSRGGFDWSSQHSDV